MYYTDYFHHADKCVFVIFLFLELSIRAGIQNPTIDFPINSFTDFTLFAEEHPDIFNKVFEEYAKYDWSEYYDFYKYEWGMFTDDLNITFDEEPNMGDRLFETQAEKLPDFIEEFYQKFFAKDYDPDEMVETVRIYVDDPFPKKKFRGWKIKRV